MAVPKAQFTPIRAARGKRVHATSMRTPTRTACGVRFAGWHVALGELDCHDCLLAVHHDMRTPKQRRDAKRRKR
jgi:hypothetical protein